MEPAWKDPPRMFAMRIVSDDSSPKSESFESLELDCCDITWRLNIAKFQPQSPEIPAISRHQKLNLVNLKTDFSGPSFFSEAGERRQPFP
nr:hypothetical protein [uncultured Shinella sp.]